VPTGLKHIIDTTIPSTSSPNGSTNTPPRTLPHFTEVDYDNKTNIVTGNVTKIEDPDKFAVIVFLRQKNNESENYKLVPSVYNAINKIDSNCSFEVQAYSIYNCSDDINAEVYSVLLVFADTSFIEAKSFAYQLDVEVWDVLEKVAIDKWLDKETHNLR
jgi:hypothetical protein